MGFKERSFIEKAEPVNPPLPCVWCVGASHSHHATAEMTENLCLSSAGPHSDLAMVECLGLFGNGQNVFFFARKRLCYSRT